jgi:DNA-binding NarL/FixJ family response regulator
MRPKRPRMPQGTSGSADRPGWGLALGPPAPAELHAETLRIGFEEYLVLSLPSSASAPAFDANGGHTTRGGLTEAEREVAKLVVAGLSNEAIARRRNVSVRTIAKQVSAIYRKLAVRSRRELSALQGYGATGDR